MRTVAVIGGSLAGLSAARALREQGYDGRIVVVGEEDLFPYDRPPLSKEFLAGKIEMAELALTTPTEDAALDLEWRLGDPATGLDRGARAVVLASGREVPADGVVVATGARARTLPGDLHGVHTLRTADDAVALRRDLVVSRRLVVIGGGFIGAEVASTARDMGLEVTVIESDPVPLGRVLGADLAATCAELHRDNGVHLITGEVVTGLAGNGRVSAVHLAGGRTEPADVVVVGIGAAPNVEWLAGSGIEHDHRGVWTDDAGATNVPQVVAAGDCAFSPCAYAGTAVRHEHWTNAVRQPAAAVSTLLGATPAPPTPPYFWSDQYGARLQFAGHRLPDDAVEIIDGDPADRRFVAGYRHNGELVAVFAMNQPKLFGRWRRQLSPRIVPAGLP